MKFADAQWKAVRYGLMTVLGALVVSCGSGSDSGGNIGGGGTGGGTGGGVPPGLEANFDSIQTNVFDQFCISCHIGATAPAGLRLDSANSFALLVGVASTQNPALMRVEPSNPGESYLIRKLEGTAGTGGQMPLGATPLPQSDIDVIRQWITDGALQDPGAPPPSAPANSGFSSSTAS